MPIGELKTRLSTKLMPLVEEFQEKLGKLSADQGGRAQTAVSVDHPDRREECMRDPYELFVRWYLRFNGSLSIENFVIHEPVLGAIPQGGETDTLGVRFPFSREAPGFDLGNDCRLLDATAIRDEMVDFVIAEVKSRNRALNDLWCPPTNPDKLRRTAYVVRWFGFCRSEDEVQRVAEDLQAARRATLGRHLVRVVYFGPNHRDDVDALGVSQVTHAEIAECDAQGCLLGRSWRRR